MLTCLCTFHPSLFDLPFDLINHHTEPGLSATGLNLLFVGTQTLTHRPTTLSSLVFVCNWPVPLNSFCLPQFCYNKIVVCVVEY